VDEALLRQLVGERLTDRPVEHCVRFLRVVEQEREIDDRELLDLTLQDPGIHREHIDRAALHRREHLHVAAQHAAREQLQCHLAAAFLRDEIGESGRPR
jgi:hypothetical protein